MEFQQQLKQRNILLQQKIMVFSSLIQMEAYSGPIIAESPAMRLVQDQIEKFTRNSGPILIKGEPGTGKAYIARKIHEQFGNTYTPLIIVDCLKIENHESGKFLFGSKDSECLVS